MGKVSLHITMAIAVLLVGLAAGQDATAQAQPTLSFEAPWARPTPPNARTGAVYGVVRNDGMTAERLVGATSPVAERIEIHETAIDGDVARMRPLASVLVPPGSMIYVQPGGVHLMLVNLTTQLRLDQSFPVTLQFESGMRLTVEIPIITGTRSLPHGRH